MITDANGVPLAHFLTGANVPDGHLALPLLHAIPPIRGRAGPPICRPEYYLADRGYGWEWNIIRVKAMGVKSLLARPGDNTHGSGLGKLRYVVERTIPWFKAWRRLRVCYEKTPLSLIGFHTLAAAMICFNKALRS
ncbi:MAG: transposase [Planctomycetes bacterium]|nr:transposase [Planctomycetota bacterium]MBE7491673.1 transposase [Planctomycetota bacterium]MBE7492524.1 transposase [Planctomycetota bacterium]MBE7492676.1 transposase [Planctomycetota bacterium]